MRNRFMLLMLVAFLLPLPLSAQIETNPVKYAASSLTQEQQSWLAKADMHQKAGWIYLHIEGFPEERGFQHGYLLAKEIKESLDILKRKWEYQSAMSWSW